jgi:sugar/nucleoside kinase (ribokinase family)
MGSWGEAARLLGKASVSVISIEDVKGDWSLAESWASQSKVFAVTDGEWGATVFAHGERQKFAAPKVTVVDATGAGDIFAASFFVKLWQTADPWAAGAFAVAVASESVTRVGIEGVPKNSSL